ncbi:hypothetical protein SARC_17286, partial [Sphaeroforma arctica JP610]
TNLCRPESTHATLTTRTQMISRRHTAEKPFHMPPPGRDSLTRPRQQWVRLALTILRMSWLSCWVMISSV